MKYLVWILILLLVFTFFGISLNCLFTYPAPECYIGIPGTFALGYIIGDYFLEKTTQIHLEKDPQG